ncbi:MAG: ArdC family protein [Isosphaeraceae bacterium]
MTHRTNTTTRQDLYSRVTAEIIAAFDRGAGRWRMPWHAPDDATFTPANAASGTPYRGVNILALWAAAEAGKYPTHRWATYRQWQALGAQVRRGERSTLVVCWKLKERPGDEQDDDRQESEARRGKRLFARGFSVFNAAQVEGYTPPAPPERPQHERITGADTFFSRLSADIRHGGPHAYYHSVEDTIQLPPFGAFRDAAYYATLAHEATHWTGHPSRLDRDLSGRFGSHAYAAEELIAELGAAFLCAHLGLANEPRPDHAA